MTPNAPFDPHASGGPESRFASDAGETGDASTPGERAAPMQALLVVPIPRRRPPRRLSVREAFLSDMSYLLPAFAVGLGILMVRGQAPFAGAVVATVGSLVLAIRIHSLIRAGRDRRRMAALEKWYLQYSTGIRAGLRREESAAAETPQSLPALPALNEGRSGEQSIIGGGRPFSIR